MDMTPATLAGDFLARSIQRDPDTFNKGKAIAYALLADGFLPIGEDGDIYALLERVEVPTDATAFLVHTTGWAAPLNSNGQVDGAPSAHAERRRVALMACVGTDSTGTNTMGSALGFQDDPDDIVLDEGAASGALADALMEAWERR